MLPDMALSILLVDDEEDITTVLKTNLELEGFVVTVYNDSVKAKDEYEPNQYDFHVLDIRLPEINGFDLAREICKTQMHMFVS
jgi:DNA-binding response OmpR family regulator